MDIVCLADTLSCDRGCEFIISTQVVSLVDYKFGLIYATLKNLLHQISTVGFSHMDRLLHAQTIQIKDWRNINAVVHVCKIQYSGGFVVSHPGLAQFWMSLCMYVRCDTICGHLSNDDREFEILNRKGK